LTTSGRAGREELYLDVELTVQDVPAKERARLPEVIQAAGYAASLIWLNAYICREMFVRYTPRMNSMQGFWIAMSRLAGTGWFHSQWYRYWDCGSPVEFIYAPLVPAMTACRLFEEFPATSRFKRFPV